VDLLALDAMRLVQADLTRTVSYIGSLTLAKLDDGSTAVFLPGGVYWVGALIGDVGEDPGVALVTVAEAVQDSIAEMLWKLWPVCGQHDSGVHPELVDGRGIWRCSQGHELSLIGELGCGDASANRK
jgi:hypothetical protein